MTGWPHVHPIVRVWKIQPGINGQLQRSPEAPVDLHQGGPPRTAIDPELDHHRSRPRQVSSEPLGVRAKVGGVGNVLPECAPRARGHDVAKATVREPHQRSSVRAQERHGDSVACHELLNDRGHAEPDMTARRAQLGCGLGVADARRRTEVVVRAVDAPSWFDDDGVANRLGNRVHVIERLGEVTRRGSAHRAAVRDGASRPCRSLSRTRVQVAPRGARPLPPAPGAAGTGNGVSAPHTS